MRFSDGHSLGPRPNQPQHGSLLVSRAGKGLVDIVHIPKVSLPLIETC